MRSTRFRAGALAVVVAAATLWNAAAANAAGGAVHTAATLLGVSCSTESFCVVVGSRFRYQDPDPFQQTDVRPLAAVLHNGRWRSTPMPASSPAGRPQIGLTAVSCTAKNFCMAIGDAESSRGGASAPAAYRWNGSRWRAVATPPVPARRQMFERSVSCTTPTNCLAVGYSVVVAGTDTPTAMRWNGRRWAMTSLAARPGSSDLLTAVSCAGSSCLAVGPADRIASGETGTTAYRWNRTRWSVVRPGGPSGGQLTAVSCPSRHECRTVGTHGPSRGMVTYAFARSLTATGWHRTTLRDTQHSGLVFSAASCATIRSCIAVGSRFSPRTQTYTATSLVFDNGRWTSHLPQNRSRQAELRAVSCPEPTSCIAAGTASNSAVGGRPLIEKWNGSHWHISELRI